MRPRQLIYFVIAVAAIVCVGRTRGDVISQYAFTGTNIDEIRVPTTVAANVTAGDITDAPIVFTHPMVQLSRATGIGYATEPVLAASHAPWNESFIRENVYFTFSVAADAGHELDLSGLTFDVARGGAATPRDYDIRTSLDGFATSLTGIVDILTERPTFTPVSVDLSATQFQNLTSPLTFQFRFFTPGFSQNVDFDNITVNGLVAAVQTLSGDHNGDGNVDAADYVMWRKNDINGQQGYIDWRTNFGSSLLGFGNSSLTTAAGVPEPAACLLTAIALGIAGLGRRR